MPRVSRIVASRKGRQGLGFKVAEEKGQELDRAVQRESWCVTRVVDSAAGQKTTEQLS